MKRKLILITGGSASGKTTVAQQLKDKFKEEATIISQDSFYLKEGTEDTNYDLPTSFDFELQNKIIKQLMDGKEVEVPTYNFSKHKREGSKIVTPAKYIIFEGLFTFYDQDTLDLADFKIFVDTPSDTRLSRRILRDINERGRDLNEVTNRWVNTVQPSYEQYIRTLKRNADVIIPWTQVKEKAIDSLVATFGILKDK